jgi:DNA-binding LytR/AlgR family response regulator
MPDNPLRVIIADDEAPAREELLHLLENIGDIIVTGVAKDGLEAEKMLREKEVDVILLDIQMPGLNGIDVARKMIAGKTDAFIIFTTAYDAFAIDAFEVHALDYLLKPLRLEKLRKAIDMARKQTGNRDSSAENRIKMEKFFESYLKNSETRKNKFISVFQGDQIIPVRIESILFAEARGRFVWISTGAKEYKTNMNFHEAEELFLPPLFFHCHRSFIVNMEAIEAVDLWVNNSYRLKIKGTDTYIPVSRSRKEEFQKLIGL